MNEVAHCRLAAVLSKNLSFLNLSTRSLRFYVQPISQKSRSMRIFL